VSREVADSPLGRSPGADPRDYDPFVSSVISIVAAIASLLAALASWYVAARLSRRSRAEHEAEDAQIEARIDGLLRRMSDKSINPGDTVTIQLNNQSVTLTNASGTAADTSVLRQLLLERDLSLADIPVVSADDRK
jgi:hypothetical protein